MTLDDIQRDLERIAYQEQHLVFDTLDADRAWALGARLRELARRRGLAVAIDVRRFNQPLFYCALPGTTPDNPAWVRRKSNVVAHFYRSSYAVGLKLKQQQASLFDKYGLPPAEYSAHGGSFPVTAKNAGIVGSVTVSGLPERQDHGLAVEALCLELGLNHADFALS